MQETAAQGHATPRLSIVSSALHKFASLDALKSPSILAALDERTEDFDARYRDSKLLLHLYGEKLAAWLSMPGKPSVCFNLVNPGYCVSQLNPPTTFPTRMAQKVMARSTDEGARTLVDAVAADKVAGRHGMYLDDMKVKRYVHIFA
jgi:retinol dehydrogenase-12